MNANIQFLQFGMVKLCLETLCTVAKFKMHAFQMKNLNL